MNTVWNVPFKDWPGFVGRRLRGFAILALLGLGILLSTTLVGIAPRWGSSTGVWAWVVSSAVNFAVFVTAFTVLTAATVKVRDVSFGALVATVSWQALQAMGDLYVRYVVTHATDVYGFFALVIGLLTWLYTGARLTLLAAELNVVLRYRLWPRSMTQPPLTAADRRALNLLARMEERRPEESVAVRYSADADRHPL